MLIIGHRGCHYPKYNQNTIRAYKKVVEDGAKAFEMDVQLTADDALVVVHNLDLTMVSNGKGLIRDKTLSEVKQLWAGRIEDGKDKIPELYEVFDLIASYPKDSRPTLNLELKGEGTGRPSAILFKNDYLDFGKIDIKNILVSSFNWNELREFRKVIPEIEVALLDGSIRRKELLKLIPDGKKLFSQIFAYGEEDYMIPKTSNLDECIEYYSREIEDSHIRGIIIDEVTKCLEGGYYTDDLIKEAKKMNAFSLNLWANTVSGEFIKKCHDNDLKVYLYTVNDPKDLDVMKKIKPDGIFTDYFVETYNYINKD